MSKLIICLSSIIILFLSGCQAGLDVTALRLKPNEIVDFGALVKNQKISPGNRAYGLLKNGYNVSPKTRIRKELDKVLEALSEIEGLDPKTPSIDNFVNYYRQIFTDNIAPMLASIENPDNAVLLAGVVADQVEDFSELRQRIKDLRAEFIGDAASSLEDFISRSGLLLSSAEHIYQMAFLYAHSRIQANFYKLLSGLKATVDNLDTILEAGPAILDANHRAVVSKQLNLLQGNLGRLERLASNITSTDKVSKEMNNIIGKLNENWAGLNALCDDPYVRAEFQVRLKDELAHAQRQIGDARYSNNLFVSGAEILKEPAEQKLQELQTRAFSGDVVVPTIPIIINKDTELNRFINILSKNKIVSLQNIAGAEQFIEALAAAVITGAARDFELFVSNVYGFNNNKLLENKALLRMSDKQFSDYLYSIAKELYEEKTNNGELAQVFVLFSDKLGEGIDWGKIVKTLSLGKSKVVLVSSNPSKLPHDADFVQGPLSIYEAYVVAEAAISSVIASMLIKAWWALDPYAINLQSIPDVVNDVRRHLQGITNPQPKQIREKVLAALGAKNLPVANLKLKIFADDFFTIEKNKDKNIRAYQYSR